MSIIFLTVVFSVIADSQVVSGVQDIFYHLVTDVCFCLKRGAIHNQMCVI